MKDSSNREILTKVYRLIEKYETPPRLTYTDEGIAYFEAIVQDCRELHDNYLGNAFARRLMLAVYDALGDRFKAVNKQPLIDRSEQ